MDNKEENACVKVPKHVSLISSLASVEANLVASREVEAGLSATCNKIDTNKKSAREGAQTAIDINVSHLMTIRDQRSEKYAIRATTESE